MAKLMGSRNPLSPNQSFLLEGWLIDRPGVCHHTLFLLVNLKFLKDGCVLFSWIRYIRIILYYHVLWGEVYIFFHLMNACPLKFLLRKAAKARIDRMCKDHSRRTELNVPDWLKKEWRTARKDDMADVLRQCNFDKDIPIYCTKLSFFESYLTFINKMLGLNFWNIHFLFDLHYSKHIPLWSSSYLSGLEKYSPSPFHQEKFVATMLVIVTKKQTIKIKKEQGWYSEDEMRDDLGWKELGAKSNAFTLHLFNYIYVTFRWWNNSTITPKLLGPTHLNCKV